MLSAILTSCGQRTAQTAEPAQIGQAAKCVEPSAAALDLFAKSSITAADNGKTVVLHETTRFSIYLDGRKYAVRQLSAAPDGILGRISNGSTGGPDCFPAMFEALKEGTALIHDRDFQLWVVVDDQAPESSIPLH